MILTAKFILSKSISILTLFHRISWPSLFRKICCHICDGQWPDCANIKSASLRFALHTHARPSLQMQQHIHRAFSRTFTFGFRIRTNAVSTEQTTICTIFLGLAITNKLFISTLFLKAPFKNRFCFVLVAKSAVTKISRGEQHRSVLDRMKRRETVVAVVAS